MILAVLHYRIIAPMPNYYEMVSWKGWLIMFTLMMLIGVVLFVLSNIVIKAYPSLSKKTQMSDIHYQESYNRKYLGKTPIINKLRTLNLWKIIALVLVVMFLFIRYYTLAFNEFRFWWY